MNNKDNKERGTLTVLVVLFLAISTVLGCWVIKLMGEGASLGSVQISHEYHSTTTREWDGGAILKTADFNQLITSSTRGTLALGSIVNASTTSGKMTIYDASSTNAVADGTYSTVIARFSSTTAAGTYTYDTVLQYGLVVGLNGAYAGDAVITWRK